MPYTIFRIKEIHRGDGSATFYPQKAFLPLLPVGLEEAVISPDQQWYTMGKESGQQTSEEAHSKIKQYIQLHDRDRITSTIYHTIPERIADSPTF